MTTIESMMEEYFRSYLRRFHHKTVNDAVNATRNQIEKYYESISGEKIGKDARRRIEAKLAQLKRFDF